MPFDLQAASWTVSCYAAMSLNGMIASHSAQANEERLGEGHTSAADQSFLKTALGNCHGVFMGARSLLPEKGLLRCGLRGNANSEPIWVIFCQDMKAIKSHSIMNNQLDIRVIFFECTDFSAAAARCWVKTEQMSENRKYMKGTYVALVEHLIKSGVSSVALLGGGALNSLLLNAGHVHRVVVTLSALLQLDPQSVAIFGSHHSIKINLLRHYFLGEHVVAEYLIEKPESKNLNSWPTSVICGKA